MGTEYPLASGQQPGKESIVTQSTGTTENPATPTNTEVIDRSMWKTILVSFALALVAMVLGWLAFGNFLSILWHSTKMIVEGWFCFSFFVAAFLVWDTRKREYSWKDALTVLAGPIGAITFVAGIIKTVNTARTEVVSRFGGRRGA